MPRSTVRNRVYNSIDINFIETSALDSSNVETAFVRIINEIYQQTLREQQMEQQQEEESSNIKESQ
jgi:hypothetical protein